MAQLEVQIGADVKDLLKKVNITEKELKKLEKTSAKSGQAISKVGLSASKGINTLGKSTANAVPALQEFSRVVQDAPYGIQGVGNNIQQLTANFGYLSKSAGGTVPALKLMVSSLVGPAGILLAVSAVTSLWTAYSNGAFGAKNKTEELAEANQKAADKMKAFIDSLNDVDKALLNGTKSAAKEIVTIKSLRSQIEDVTNSTDLRLDGIKTLRKEFGGYFENISNEALLNGTAADSYDTLTNSILKRAKATAATNILVKNAERELDINEKIKSLEEEKQKEQDKLNKLNETNRGQSLQIGDATSGISKDLKDAVASEKSINNILKEQTDLREDLAKISKSNLELEAVVKANEIVLKEPSKKGSKKEQKADKDYAKQKQKLFDSIAAEQIKAEEKAIDEFIKNWEGVQIEVDPFDGDFLQIQEGYKEILAVESKIKEIQKLLSSLHIDNINLEGLSLEQLNTFQSKLINSIGTADIFSDAVGNSFRALSNQITDSFNTGSAVLDTFVGSIISSLAQIAAASLQSLITEKIIGVGKTAVNRGVSSGNAITVATSAAAALGPAGVFALPGLVASQLALVNGAFAASSFALGSGGFSGDNNLAYLNRNEMILRPMEQSALYNAIRGHNLGSLSNNTTGSNLSDGFIGDVVLRGDKQVIQFRRGERKMNRFYKS